ncbi:MAG: thermonuclease family protein [Alphaproteobacteria bacterium]|nr:thermonuclease family protein [Alphaproteobacteria bacterium]
MMIDIKRLLSLGFCRRRGTYMNSMTEARRRTGMTPKVGAYDNRRDALESLVKVAVLLACTAAIAAGPALGRAKRSCVPEHPILPRMIDGEGFAVDGDTIVLLVEGQRFGEVRLFGIDAPELRSRMSKEEPQAGLRARDALDRLLSSGGDRVRVIPIEHDRYCRIVGRIEVGGHDIAEAMLRGGWAYVFTTWAFGKGRDPGLAKGYIALQRQARDDDAGLWPLWLGKR